MHMALAEQETTINFMRDSDACTVYTSDSTVMTKLDKLAESDEAPHWKCVKVHKALDGTVVGKTYETHKKLISFRVDIVTREMTDEQRQAAAERLRKARQKIGTVEENADGGIHKIDR